MKLTLELARSKHACADGLAWFESTFGAEADYQLVLDTLAENNRLEWVSWLTEIECSAVASGVVAFGTLKIVPTETATADTQVSA